MNLPMIGYMLGWALNIEALFLLLPVAAAIYYGESSLAAYIAVAALSLVAGQVLMRRKPADKSVYAREGFVTVALSWIVLSLMGALPFMLTGEIPVYHNALFETVSGFTTTGATILTDVEALSRASLLWRSTTHWIGGMGVLVFMLALLPMAGVRGIHLMRAESPGPSVSKFSPHMRDTALILYGIYIALTALETVLLLIGGMPFYDAFNVAMSTAGTGGFGLYGDSVAHYASAYLQWVIAVFMVLFGVNFAAYFLVLKRRPREILRMEEVKLYFAIIAVATAVITFNIRGLYPLAEAVRHAFFQVGTIITTTGFATADFNLWPVLSKYVLVLLMFVGACAGSTGGGMKVSRVLLLLKSVRKEMQYLIHPRSVKITNMDDKRVAHEVMRSVNIFFIVYMLIFAASVVALSFDRYDTVTNFTAVAATVNNVGPGLHVVGPNGNFSGFSVFSKLVLIFDMLAGRLELFPMLILFNPATWRKR